MAAWPVISVSLSGLRSREYDEILDDLKKAISYAYSDHLYLLAALDRIQQNPASSIPERVRAASDQKTFMKFYEANGKLPKADLYDALKDLSGMLHRHFGKKVIIIIDDYDRGISWMLQKGTKENIEKTLDLFKQFIGETFKNNVQNLQKGYMTG